MPTARETLALLQEHMVAGLIEGRDPVRTGGFLTLFHPTDDLVWRNQTVPMDRVSPKDVIDLLALYRERSRTPWLEFSPQLAPELPEMLVNAGLVCNHEMPVMTLSSEDWEPKPTSARPPREEEMADFSAVAQRSFGMEPASPEDIAAQWRTIAAGRVLAALLEVEGKIVSVGQAVGTVVVREVAGLATEESYRRRGYCTQVIHTLLGKHFGAGGELAWLTPGDAGAERVYAAAGFQTIGTQLTFGTP